MYGLYDHYHHQIIIILSCFAENSHWNNELTDLSFFHIQCLKLRESVALMNSQGQFTRRLLTWLCRKSCLGRTNVSTCGLKFNNVSSTWNFGVHASIIFIITFQVHCRIFTVVCRGGSRGRVQGGAHPPTPPWDDLRFSNTTGILQKKICGLLVLK